MAQLFFGTLTAPPLAWLDLNFSELYGFAKNLVSDPSGSVGVGEASPSTFGKFVVRQTVAGATGAVVITESATSTNQVLWSQANSGNNSFMQFGTETGTLVSRGSITYNRAGGLVAYNTTSDYRAKTLHGPLANPLAALAGMAVYMGTMNGATTARPMFVAHELAVHAPYAVTGAKDAVDAQGRPVLQQVDTSALVPLLVAAVQALAARVAALEAAAAP